MNTKKIKLHDHHYDGMMPLRNPSPARSSAARRHQLPAFPTGLSSPFGQGFLSSGPQYQQYQGGAGAGRSREEYDAAPSSAFAQSCVGSSREAFYAAENLLGMAQFDCAPLGMFPPATTPTPFRSSAESELLYRPLDPTVMLRAADQSSSVRTYYVRPQQQDAAELQLLASTQQQQQQERAHHHGLFANAASSSSLESQMEQHLPARSLVSAPAASHAGSAARPATPPASKTRIRWTQDLHERGDAEGDPEADELGRAHHLPHQEPSSEIPYGQVHATTIFTIRRETAREDAGSGTENWDAHHGSTSRPARRPAPPPRAARGAAEAAGEDRGAGEEAAADVRGPAQGQPERRGQLVVHGPGRLIR
ncbi:unnamed protein product [Alopecurus aequalis]